MAYISLSTFTDGPRPDSFEMIVQGEDGAYFTYFPDPESFWNSDSDDEEMDEDGEEGGLDDSDSSGNSVDSKASEVEEIENEEDELESGSYIKDGPYTTLHQALHDKTWNELDYHGIFEINSDIEIESILSLFDWSGIARSININGTKFSVDATGQPFEVKS